MSGIMMISVGNSYGSLPLNTVAPSVTGTVQVGQTLSCSTGTWTSAPAITGYTYQWQRGGSNISGQTSNTYTIQSADVGSTLRCVVTATNALGSTSANSNSTGTVPAVTGQVAYTSPGDYTFIVPAGVTRISAVAVGGGGSGVRGGINGGGGGGLSYNNNITVTPGDSLPVKVASGAPARSSTANGSPGQESFLRQPPGFPEIVYATGGGGGTGSGRGAGGTGGAGGTSVSRTGGLGGDYGGGGAAGYSGNGGAGNTQGGSQNQPGSSGSGGGGAGGTSTGNIGPKFVVLGGTGGGGVGILGEGASGVGVTAGGGGGGSGGSSGGGADFNNAGGGGTYGGGGGAHSQNNVFMGGGGNGAVRIIWPGNTRQFPSTNTGNL